MNLSSGALLMNFVSQLSGDKAVKASAKATNIIHEGKAKIR